VNGVVVTLESTVGWFLSGFAFLFEMLEAIPVLGGLIRWVLNAVTHVLHIVLSIPDALFGLIGIRPEKKLRVAAVILSDETGPVVSNAAAREFLQLACDVYKRDANVRVVPLLPFQYDSGFTGRREVTDDWIQVVTDPPDADILDLPCGFPGAGKELWLAGSKLQLLVSTRAVFGAWRRVLGYGAPVTLFFVRTTPGDAVGCNIWVTDYATVSAQAVGSSPRTAAHELGHACNLWHVCVDTQVNNLMATQGSCDPESTTEPDRVNPALAWWQVLLVRLSKHVTYF
jgi:hypothetical protein